MSLNEPEFDWTDGILVPEERVLKSAPASISPERLGSRIRLGGPVSRPLQRSGLEDARVLAVLEDERSTTAYTITDLAVTFDPVDGEVFEQAWIVLGLSAPHSINPPIAWSMLPDLLSSATETTGDVAVKADLKLVSVGGSISRKVGGEDIYLEAQNMMRSDPTWEFTRSGQRDIRGSHRLIMVTRSGIDDEVTGQISIFVTVRRRHWGIFPYTVQLGDRTTQQFLLKPSRSSRSEVAE